MVQGGGAELRRVAVVVAAVVAAGRAGAGRLGHRGWAGQLEEEERVGVVG